MPKKYYFDTSIAPLSKDEEEIIKMTELFLVKRDLIYQRTDKVIKNHIKKEKKKAKTIALEKKLKREKELELQREKEEQLEIEKKINFPFNLAKLKQKINNLINSINFYNNKEKISELTKLQKDFQEYCIHPLNLKCKSSYTKEYYSGYGMSSTHEYTSDSCILCKKCPIYKYDSEIDIEDEFIKQLKMLSLT